MKKIDLHVYKVLKEITKIECMRWIKAWKHKLSSMFLRPKIEGLCPSFLRDLWEKEEINKKKNGNALK